MVVISSVALLSLLVRCVVLAHPAALTPRDDACSSTYGELTSLLKSIPEAVSYCKSAYPPKPSACSVNKRAASSMTSTTSIKSAASSSVTSRAKASTSQGVLASALSELRALATNPSAVSTLCGCVAGPVSCTTATSATASTAKPTITGTTAKSTGTTTMPISSTSMTGTSQTVTTPTSTIQTSSATTLPTTMATSSSSTSSTTSITSTTSTTSTQKANPTSCADIETADPTNPGYYIYTSNGKQYHLYCSAINGSTRYYSYSSDTGNTFKQCLDNCATDTTSGCVAVTYEEDTTTCYYSASYDRTSNADGSGYDSGNLARLD